MLNWNAPNIDLSPLSNIDKILGKLMHNRQMKFLTENKSFFFKKLGFTPCKAEQPLQHMELQGKETQRD